MTMQHLAGRFFPQHKSAAFFPVLLLLCMSVLPLSAQSGTGLSSETIFSYSTLRFNAAGEPPWLSFERGKRLYTARDFGDALAAFDSAILFRRQVFALVQTNLQRLAETSQYMDAADSITALLAAYSAEDFLPDEYLQMQKHYKASTFAFLQHLRSLRISENHRTFIEILLIFMDYRALDSLDDSLYLLGQQIQLLSRYPEAEFWKGRVFLLEGEVRLAELQFMRALEQRASLEIPEDVYHFQYELADLYRLQDNLRRWEEVLQRILVDDPITGDPPIDPYLRDAMLRTLSNEGFDKFMTLYRIDPGFSLQANRELATFMLEHGRSAVKHASVASCMVITSSIELISTRDRDYRWAGLAHFLDYIRDRPDVMSYIAEQDLYALLFTLADALYVDSAYANRAAASYIWQHLVRHSAAPWSALAAERVRDPQSAVRR
ncbi:MAG: hypothetical protein KKI09_03095 [Spirochaetes bacterium]|nr:hypothetical protein [Spirochaetota bacterium]MBU0954392.1 hypothetical protein [Spirochaetota bacterium]